MQPPRCAPFITAPEWRCGLIVRAELIRVAPRCGAVARVKLIGNVVRLRDPDVGWEQRIERSTKPGGIPRLRHSHVRSLSSRVNPCVCPSCPNHRDRPLEQSFEYGLDSSLNRYRCRLSLPAGEPRPVILKHELYGPLPHAAELIFGGGYVKQRSGDEIREQ